MNVGNLGLVPTPRKPRTYDASARRTAAEGTRLRVLSAARHLFLTQGYAATSVARIARQATVSVDTVYATVGRKPDLMLAVHDMVLASSSAPLPAGQRDYVVAVREAPSARVKIELYAAAMSRLLPTTTPLMNALADAGASDSRCLAMWNSINERRAANMLLFAADLRATGELRDDLTDQRVADLVWSMNSPAFFGLHATRGATPEEFGALLADVWTRTLLAG